ncbi:hypothetical protein ACODT3_04680 [Streptomyces sp. 4.24]|uniref:hypothetical protein n=1 Tax=Streptomyces tritrimontium TaxID=3406573 RepID=UPI003BB71246
MQRPLWASTGVKDPAHFDALERVGVDFADVTDTLERSGLLGELRVTAATRTLWRRASRTP